ncbi:hypothetical protein EDC04DRAFT_2904564 [Pisolithus marmoratus]|nr:hypothetical protein EDC04DRAFT_2904564 [Pisolithus marmoratus]
MSFPQHGMESGGTAPAQGVLACEEDIVCVKRCEEVIGRYRKGDLSKSEALLTLREALVDAPSVKSGGSTSLLTALAIYIDMLDEADRSIERAAAREPGEPSQTLSEATSGGGLRPEPERRSQEGEASGSDKSSEKSSDFGEAERRPAKRVRTQLNVSLFPWNERRESQVASLPEDIKSTFEQIKLYSRDPKQVVEHILSTPGCPPFPPSQWLNLVQWKYVDLAKVLESAHTTELDPKQSHIIDDKVELSFRVSKPTGAIKSATDHNTAFTMFVKALSFVFPSVGKSTRSTSRNLGSCSTPLSPLSIPGSLTTTEPSEIVSRSNDTSMSLILPTSTILEPPSSPLMESVPIPLNQQLRCGLVLNQDPRVSVMNPAISGTVDSVRNLKQSVSTPIAVIEGDVGVVTEGQNARKLPKLNNKDIARGPRYRRHHVWGHSQSVFSRTALWTESASPLPMPPAQEYDNTMAFDTVTRYPHLFRIVTPINVNRLEGLLSDHPNPQFVHSVLCGLREGFWPFAHTHPDEWPVTWDNSHRPLKSADETEFVRSQVLKEVEKGCFSESFGPDLLPGMYSMPVHAVPKPGAKKFRLVTDHSAGLYALNNMISKEDVSGVTLDNVYDLGQALREYRSIHPLERLVIWKGDVSKAYRLMPMHPLWQLKQIVTMDGNRYVDRCDVFGGHASQRIWHAFMSLVLWIIVFKLLIAYAYLYVDDSFGFAPESSLQWYLPYSKLLPSLLVTVLNLWDSLGIPHEEKKQLFGSVLLVIGFEVDPNLMRVQMSLNSWMLLLEHLRSFAFKGA